MENTPDSGTVPGPAPRPPARRPAGPPACPPACLPARSPARPPAGLLARRCRRKVSLAMLKVASAYVTFLLIVCFSQVFVRSSRFRRTVLVFSVLLAASIDLVAMRAILIVVVVSCRLQC